MSEKLLYRMLSQFTGMKFSDRKWRTKMLDWLRQFTGMKFSDRKWRTKMLDSLPRVQCRTQFKFEGDAEFRNLELYSM